MLELIVDITGAVLMLVWVCFTVLVLIELARLRKKASEVMTEYDECLRSMEHCRNELSIAYQDFLKELRNNAG